MGLSDEERAKHDQAVIDALVAFAAEWDTLITACTPTIQVPRPAAASCRAAGPRGTAEQPAARRLTRPAQNGRFRVAPWGTRLLADGASPATTNGYVSIVTFRLVR
jgi:hypothetical protein